jgi:hypothetical protein
VKKIYGLFVITALLAGFAACTKNDRSTATNETSPGANPPATTSSSETAVPPSGTGDTAGKVDTTTGRTAPDTSTNTADTTKGATTDETAGRNTAASEEAKRNPQTPGLQSGSNTEEPKNERRAE